MLVDLCEFAESRGVLVAWAIGLPEMGRWVPERRMIILRHGLTDTAARSILAHELGHAHHGDDCSTPAAEARAWRFAARLLITPREYAAAEALHPATGAVARELGVLVDVVEAYQGMKKDGPTNNR